MATQTRRTLAGSIRDVSARCTHSGCPWHAVEATQSKATFALALHVRRVHPTQEARPMPDVEAAKALISRSMRENAQLVDTDPASAAERLLFDMEFLAALLNGECSQNVPALSVQVA